jgi:transcriptional regulator with XRE-family HTH domain
MRKPKRDIPTAILLRSARKLAGFTQVELAKRSRVSFATINRLESGHFCPQPGTVTMLCQALGLQVEEWEYFVRVFEERQGQA